jgi:hypothetical protein
MVVQDGRKLACGQHAGGALILPAELRAGSSATIKFWRGSQSLGPFKITKVENDFIEVDDGVTWDPVKRAPVAKPVATPKASPKE